jgi:predicted ATPase
MLAEGYKKVDSIKDKDIISFYGMTASGKSTAINYLLHIPLKT